MPLYEYICEECEAKFEVLILGRVDENIRCPKCSSEKCKRLISSFSSPSAPSGGCSSCSSSSCSSCRLGGA